MDINSEKSSKIKFIVRTTNSIVLEITVNSTDLFQSVIDRFNKDNQTKEKYNAALFDGDILDLSKSIFELNIKEGSNVILCHLPSYNNDNKKEENKKVEIVPNRESPTQTQVGTKYHKHGVVLLYSNEDWTCEKCNIFKRNFEPKYHCSLPNCNFNICTKCIENNSKYPLTDFTHKQISLKKYNFSCHNHPLLYCRSSRHSNNLNFWNCNACKLTFTNRIWSFYCTYCDFDYCLICARKAPIPDKDEDLLNGWGIKIDKHEHTLIYLINNRNWTCKICDNSFNSNIAKFYCSICNYNLCKNCKDELNNENKNTNLNLNYRSYTDDKLVDTKYHNHSLIYCNTSRNETQTSWNCNVCKVKFGPQTWSFYCTKCDFDVCDNCYKKSKSQK